MEEENAMEGEFFKGKKPLEFVIVGAPEEGGGVSAVSPFRNSSSAHSAAGPSCRAPPPAKRARLYRVFEYDESQVEHEQEVAARVLRKMKKRKKSARPNRGNSGNVKGKEPETSDTETYSQESIEGIEYDEEVYVIHPLYHAKDVRDDEELEDEEDEVAVICQAEHQYTGLVNQSALQRKSDVDGSNWRIAGSGDYEAQRLDWLFFEGDSGKEEDSGKEGEGEPQTMEDLELDYTAHLCYSMDTRVIEAGRVHPEKEVYHAFHQVPGRPNVYAFGSFKGMGFDGCGLYDSWSDPRLILRRDVHVQTWEDGSYDYVLQDPKCTPTERKKQLKFSRAKPSHSLRYASTSREDAKRKLDCLTLQLREYCVERAFQDRAIDRGRVVLWQGDPKPRVVFLFKAVTKRVVGAAPYRMSTKNSTNGLGILQTELRLALEDAIRECYSHAYGEIIPWQRMQEFMKAMIPLCCQETGPAEKGVNTSKGGVALLYGVPIYDPTGWGKHAIDQYGYTEYDADYSQGNSFPKRFRKKQTQQSGIAGSEFPDNVLELTSFYVQKALDIMAPMVVVSLNKFLTRYLNSGLDSKMLQWARDVRPNKWFRVKLLSARGNANVRSSGKFQKKGKDAGNARVIQMVDPMTGVVVDEQRAETFGIRSFHPFYVTQNPQERHPVAKQTMVMVAKRLFQEMEMTKLIAGKGHAVTRFYLNPTQAMRNGTMKKDQEKRNAKFEGIPLPGVPRWIGGNLICREATMKQIEMMTDHIASTSLISVFVLCDCDPGEECECAFQTLLGTKDNGGNYVRYHIPLRENASSCSEACVFPPRIPITSVLERAQLWPSQWMYEYVSGSVGNPGKSGKSGKRNHFTLPRFREDIIDSMEKHEEAMEEVLGKIKEILDRAVPKEDGPTYDAKARLSLKAKFFDLRDGRPSGLFTKRVIVDKTRHYGGPKTENLRKGEESVDVGVYFASIMETLELVLYTLYMKDYLDGKRAGIAGATKAGREARKGFKRIKRGDRYLTPAEQLPSVGQIVGHVVRSRTASMDRLNQRGKKPSGITLSEEEDLGKEEEEEEHEEEEVWGVLEWTETLTQVAMKAKETYEKNKQQLKQLSL